jgi:uncharacterized membrane protein
MKDVDGFIVYAGEYANLNDARDDFEAIKTVHREKFVGHYEAALFTKEPGGKVKIINTDETPRAHGAVGGAIVGAVIGVIFPPSLLLLAAGGAGVGALIGHVAEGMPRGDIKEIGEMLDDGEAGIIFIGETTLDRGAERIMAKADKVMEKELKAETKELKKAMKEAA